MNAPATSRIGPRLVLGLFVVLVGVLLLLDNLGVTDIEDYWRWWPMILIAVGLARAAQSGGGAGRGSGLVIAAVGGLLLLDSLRVLQFDFWELWPLVVIGVGLSMIWGAVVRSRASGTGGSSTSAASVNVLAVLGGANRGSNSQDFRGGDASAFLGACEIDLRRASMPAGGTAVIDALAFWGGIEIHVPEDWSVVLQVTPILGAVEDKTRRPTTPTKTLVVKGLVIMGGVEITN